MFCNGAEIKNKQNEAQKVHEISRLGYLVIAYLGSKYNILICGLEYPTSAIVPNLLNNTIW